MTPLLGWLGETIFGESPRGLRVLSAVAVAVVVVFVALLARELGAGAGGQVIAAAGTAGAAFVLAVGHLLSTSTFDLLVWITTLLVVARILGGGDRRLWLLAGAVVGVGLENKQLPLLLVCSLVIGLAIDRRLVPGSARRGCGVAPRSRWRSGFRIRLAGRARMATARARDIRRDEGAESRATLFPFQLLLVSPFLTPLLAAGLWGSSGTCGLALALLGIAYVVLLVLLLATGGKPYYAAPFLLCLLAAGSVPFERWLSTRGRQLALAACLMGSAAVAAVIALPVLPVDRLGSTPVARTSTRTRSRPWGGPSSSAPLDASSPPCPPQNRRPPWSSPGTTGKREPSIATAPNTGSAGPTRGTTPTPGSASRMDRRVL